MIAGKATGMSILIDDELLVGRLADGAGRLADDEDISRSHARFTVDEDGLCAIEDLNSMNGTYVNGLRIATPSTLKEGDTIEIGTTTLVVRELPSSAAQEAPAAAAQPSATRPNDKHPAAPPAASSAAEPDPAPAPDEPTEPPTSGEPDPAPTPDLPGESKPAGPRELEFRVMVELRVVVDPDGGSAQILAGNGSRPVALVFADGAWQLEPSV